MKKKYDAEKKVIDSYYSEASKFSGKEETEFAECMVKALDKMDVIKDLDFPTDINILEIISKGEKIRDNRKTKYELVGFAAACLSIMSVLAALLTSGNPKIYLYIYGIISVLLPLVIIPIAANTKEEA